MPSFKDVYHDPLLSAEKLGKRVIKGVIMDVYRESQSGKGQNAHDRLVIELDDDETRISLNKGNARILGRAYGEDYDGWKGKKIKITTHMTSFDDKPCLGLLITPISK
jgi:hypothetical protein